MRSIMMRLFILFEAFIWTCFAAQLDNGSLDPINELLAHLATDINEDILMHFYESFDYPLRKKTTLLLDKLNRLLQGEKLPQIQRIIADRLLKGLDLMALEPRDFGQFLAETVPIQHVIALLHLLGHQPSADVKHAITEFRQFLHLQSLREVTNVDDLGLRTFIFHNLRLLDDLSQRLKRRAKKPQREEAMFYLAGVFISQQFTELFKPWSAIQECVAECIAHLEANRDEEALDSYLRLDIDVFGFVQHHQAKIDFMLLHYISLAQSFLHPYFAHFSLRSSLLGASMGWRQLGEMLDYLQEQLFLKSKLLVKNTFKMPGTCLGISESMKTMAKTVANIQPEPEKILDFSRVDPRKFKGIRV